MYTAAAKNVLSPISDRIVIASDFANPFLNKQSRIAQLKKL